MITENIINSKSIINKKYSSILIENYGIDPDEDGCSHINIGDLAKTELGRVLDIYYNKTFTHSKLGVFKSLGGLYYYLKYNYNELFRDTYGYRVKQLVKSMSITRSKPNLEFKLMVADSIYNKVINDKELVSLLINDDLKELPFKSYYKDYNGTPKENKISIWYIPIMTTIRDHLLVNVDIINSNVNNLDIVDLLEYPNFNIS